VVFKQKFYTRKSVLLSQNNIGLTPIPVNGQDQSIDCERV